MAPMRTGRAAWIVVALLVAATLTAYWPVTGNAFIPFDDDEYVTDNPVVRDGWTARGVAWAFTAFHSNNWHPLTWLAHMTDAELFGLDAGGHHRTSLVLHALNAALLFLLLRAMTGALWPAALVAALFALHPLHVESVAWASEKKDLLSTLFWLLTVGAYWRYARRPGLGRYLAVVALFALGLLAKPMLVTLPFVLLLLDFWPLARRLQGSLLLEKVPLLALSAASCVVTWLAQQSGGVVKSLESFPLSLRLTNAVVAYIAYVGKLVWPTRLALVYPHPRTFPPWEVLGAVALLAGVSVLVVVLRRRRPYLLFGWLFFLGTLVPVIGVVQVGNQAYADRYTYVPAIGVFVMLAWGLRDLLAWRPPLRPFVAVAVVAVLVFLGARTRAQTRLWKNGVTIFEHTVAVTRDNYRMHDYLGTLLAKEGRIEEALASFREAVRIRPQFTQAQYNAGSAAYRLGRYEEAEAYLSEAVRQEPDYLMAQFNLAATEVKLNRAEPAMRHLREVLRLDPVNVAAHRALGEILRRLGREDEARPHLAEAERLARAASP